MKKTLSTLSFYERVGVLALLAFLAFFLWLRAGRPHASRFELNHELMALADSLSQTLDTEKESSNRFQTAKIKNDRQLNLRPFDPNSVSEVQMRAMGFPDKLIRNIVNYRNKVGSFRTPQDFSRLYALDKKTFVEMRPYLLLAKAEKSLSPQEKSTKETIYEIQEEIHFIDVNSADSLDWLMLKGIGPSYASRILRFRSALGGFVAIDQIKETYHLPDSVFNKIRPYLRLDGSQIQRININKVSEKELSAHPYISRKEARSIIRYREQHGNFTDTKHLYKVLALKAHTVDRISPYLAFQ